MTVQSNFSAIRGIPFNQLILAPENVRKTDSETGIEELADLIDAEGVVQNLAGYEVDSAPGKRRVKQFAAVVAGGRRLRALGLLLKQKRIPPSYVVPMLVTSKERAIAISLAENSGRQALHPADEFEAFRALVDAGQSIEEVAAHFGVKPLTVQRRLKLANVAPEFIQLYREKKISLEHLMAFAVTEDHDKQRQAWKGLPSHSRSPYALRSALTTAEVSARDPMARFVTIKAYEQAGGKCRLDLFSEENDVFLLDVGLLNRLAQQKLEKHAKSLQEEGGVAWTDVIPRVDYAARAGYSQVGTIQRQPTKKEQGKLEAVDQELLQISAEVKEAGENQPAQAKLDKRLERAEAAKDSLRQVLTVPDPEQQAKAGALICIDNNGKAHVETGLLRPEDAKLFAAKAKGESQSALQGSRTHSSALMLRLTARRTQALRAVFAQSPEVALAAIVHHFVINTFGGYQSASDTALRIDTREVALQAYANDLEATPAHAWLEAQEKHLRSTLPQDPQALFQWILDQSYVEKLALLAFCASRCLDAVQNDDRESDADVLARALSMDMRKWWTPSAVGYFGCIPREASLKAVAEGASAEAAARMEKLKRKPLAVEAEKALAGTGWMPEFLRASWVPSASKGA